ncbi:MAG: hypothetical protein SFU98_19120 [Leptospiraceae bacterium]|nr:hypothetical protein [Leptospiraceae bacterium]
MRLLSDEFKKKLTETIVKIENNSGIEVVVAIGKKSGNYLYVPLLAGAILNFGVFTYAMFTDEEFDDLLIYMASILTFCIGFGIFSIPYLASFFVPSSIKKRNTEIYARALFQKGKIYETVSRQGILVYVSQFEKEVVVVEDSGVFKRIPLDKLTKLKDSFLGIFSYFPSFNTGTRLLSSLESIIPICKEFIPREENDVNEIPDDLEITL